MNEFKFLLTGPQAVYFVPFFSINPSDFTEYAGLLDGALNWNAGWPTNLNPSNFVNMDGTPSNIDGTATDLEYLTGLSNIGGSYLPTVSPWFFTHYGPNSFNKNVSNHITSHVYSANSFSQSIYCADNWMFADRWEKVISERESFDIVRQL